MGMSNQDKILALLEKMNGRLSSLETEASGIKEGQTSLETDIAGIKEGQTSLETDIAGIKEGQTSLETDIASIKEGQTSLETDIAGIKEGQTSDRELLELTLSQVGKLTIDMNEVKSEIKDIKKTVVRIENEHGEKLSALFDGYKQNTEKLTRIEEEVSKHEEIIWKRVR
jgi:predicted  nucleic acid-binding Zn-ribbon protein